jgi:hypothetical protein
MGVKGGRRIRLVISTPSVSQLSIKYVSLDVSLPYGSLWSVRGIAFPYLYLYLYLYHSLKWLWHVYHYHHSLRKRHATHRTLYFGSTLIMYIDTFFQVPQCILAQKWSPLFEEVSGQSLCVGATFVGLLAILFSGKFLGPRQHSHNLPYVPRVSWSDFTVFGWKERVVA